MREAIIAGDAAAIGPYSHGTVASSGLVFLSGQTPLDPTTGKLVEGDIAKQTAQCLQNLRSVLAQAGMSFDDVLKCNVYLVDMADFAAMNAVYETHFGHPFPARTTIGVAALPADAAVEIEMIAQQRPSALRSANGIIK